MQSVQTHSRGRQFMKDLAPWGVGVLIVVLAVGVVKQGLKRYAIENEIRGLETSAIDLKAKNGELVDLLDYVKSPAYTEEQARLQFGFAKAGERVAIIPEGIVLGVRAEGNSSSEASTESPPNAHKWWSYFFPSQQ